MKYQLNKNIRPFISYDGFYINHLIRPGNVINRNINLSQNTLVGGSGVLIGPASPLMQFRNTSMWMQGISVGLDFSW